MNHYNTLDSVLTYNIKTEESNYTLQTLRIKERFFPTLNCLRPKTAIDHDALYFCLLTTGNKMLCKGVFT